MTWVPSCLGFRDTVSPGFLRAFLIFLSWSVVVGCLFSDSSSSFLPRSVNISVFFLSLHIFDDFLCFQGFSFCYLCLFLSTFSDHPIRSDNCSLDCCSTMYIWIVVLLQLLLYYVVICIQTWFLFSHCQLIKGRCYIDFVLFCSCLAVFLLYLICLLWVLFVEEYSMPPLSSLLYNPLVACLLLHNLFFFSPMTLWFIGASGSFPQASIK